MKNYLSYGGGVNSTAMMILLKKQGVEFEAVFADHGGDYPETYAYTEMLQKEGYPITIVDCKIHGLDLYDYSMEKRIAPSRWFRWCTDQFKVKPLHKYFDKPCVDLIGIDAGEVHRAKPMIEKGIERRYPLIDQGIDRKGCIQIIKDAGFSVPRKSGCYFCPFMRKGEWTDLRDRNDGLWCKVKKLEDTMNERLKEKGQPPVYLARKSLDATVQEGQLDLFGIRKPCQCDL